MTVAAASACGRLDTCSSSVAVVCGRGWSHSVNNIKFYFEEIGVACCNEYHHKCTLHKKGVFLYAVALQICFVSNMTLSPFTQTHCQASTWTRCRANTQTRYRLVALLFYSVCVCVCVCVCV